MLVDAAVGVVRARTGRGIENYAVRLTDWDFGLSPSHGAQCVHLALSDALYEQKLRAAATYGHLQDEIAHALQTARSDHFRVECLVRLPHEATPEDAGTPHYEIVGRDRVAAGIYRSAILYREHVRPVSDAVRAYARSLV